MASTLLVTVMNYKTLWHLAVRMSERVNNGFLKYQHHNWLSLGKKKKSHIQSCGQFWNVFLWDALTIQQKNATGQ